MIEDVNILGILGSCRVETQTTNGSAQVRFERVHLTMILLLWSINNHGQVYVNNLWNTFTGLGQNNCDLTYYIVQPLSTSQRRQISSCDFHWENRAFEWNERNGQVGTGRLDSQRSLQHYFARLLHFRSDCRHCTCKVVVFAIEWITPKWIALEGISFFRAARAAFLVFRPVWSKSANW